MRIFKYELPVASKATRVEMPRDAEILSCGNQREKLVVWAKVIEGHTMTERLFDVRHTGDDEPARGKAFVGTALFDGGRYVLHVFDCGEVS